jgi:hypothetical protein
MALSHLPPESGGVSLNTVRRLVDDHFITDCDVVDMNLSAGRLIASIIRFRRGAG